jgi:hypothetical protein
MASSNLGCFRRGLRDEPSQIFESGHHDVWLFAPRIQATTHAEAAQQLRGVRTVRLAQRELTQPFTNRWHARPLP